MIPASQVVELFDAAQVAPGAGNDLHVGGYENDMNSGKTVYFPGGYGTVGSLASSVSDAGPSGLLLAGGGRRRKSRKVRKSRKARTQKKNKKVRFSRRNQLFRFRQ